MAAPQAVSVGSSHFTRRQHWLDPFIAEVDVALQVLAGQAAAARPNPALDHLQRKVDAAIRRVGQAPDSHKFTPHVTVARLGHSDPDKVVEWLQYNALYTSAEFEVGAFALYSSLLTSDGSVYRVEEEYPLGGHYDEADD